MVRPGPAGLVGALLIANILVAETNAPPEVVGVDFQDADAAGNVIRPEGKTEWIRDVRQASGWFDAARHAWVAPAGLAFGAGRLNIRLNREELPSDLALTLVYEETPEADFVVQLWDDQDRIVALDLFSDIITAGMEAQTDTFIIPFARYPAATQIVLRRLEGEVRIYGFVLYPVACEAPAPCDELDLAVQLGDRLSPGNPLVQEADRIAATQNRRLAWETHEVQQPVSLAEKNKIAHEALSKEGYPVFVPSPELIKGNFLFATTGSALFFVRRCLRTLNLHHPEAIGRLLPGFNTSMDAQAQLLSGAAAIGLMSIPMTIASKERFYRENGYHLMEMPVAIDAIQVVVNVENPLDALTVPQVDAIYGTELRAGAPGAVRRWGDLGLEGEWAEAPIEAWGGNLPGGTAQVFQKLILQGGPYRSDIHYDNESYYYGVVKHVGADRFAIGFSNLQHHVPRAKQLALARNSGKPAYRPDAEGVYGGNYPLTRFLYLYVNARSPRDMEPAVRELVSLIYSRTGQKLVGEVGQIPLSAELVRDIRNRLAL